MHFLYKKSACGRHLVTVASRELAFFVLNFAIYFPLYTLRNHFVTTCYFVTPCSLSEKCRLL